MIKYIVSRYNQSIDWMKDYSTDVVIYDRSEVPLEGATIVPNVGSDLYDKLHFIIENYDNLPDVATYIKCNLFKYITQEEYDLVKDNKTFTPILTQYHRTYSDARGVVCYYKDGLYYERNDGWFLTKAKSMYAALEVYEMMGIREMDYVGFAPGSNYILPKENILKHSKEFYQKLRSYCDWDVYPSEAMIIERGLYYLWK